LCALGGWLKVFEHAEKRAMGKNFVLWLLFFAAKNRNGVKQKRHRPVCWILAMGELTP
jgi:hypothetical protein